MKASTLGIDLLALRRAAGLNQGQLAAQMGTAQPAIARAEAGKVMPSVEFIERWAQACGMPYTLVLGGEQPTPTAKERQAMVRSIFGEDNWNPYDRAPSAVERRTLAANGVTPDRWAAASARTAMARVTSKPGLGRIRP